MGVLSVLTGRGKSQRKRYFSIVKAAESLRQRSELRLGGKAGVVFHPTESEFLSKLDSELRELLKTSGRASRTRYEITDDSFGTRWVVVDDRHWEGLVSTVHQVGEIMTEQGAGDRLMAAVFRFDYEGKKAYWIYSIKRGNYSPFVPAEDEQRDNAAEMRLGTLMQEEKVPLERSLEQWYSLWGIPF